jgi:GNAT superfamily N-acetyltransferase
MTLLRPARPDEAALLSDLAVRSKGHWGYDADFLAGCRAVLAIEPGEVIARRTTVAEVDGVVAGHYLIDGDPPGAELGQLFVDPPFIGRGIGRRLWEHAVATAADVGIRTLEIAADPFAEAFYLAMGARRDGTVASEVTPGRELPRLTFAVPHG